MLLPELISTDLTAARTWTLPDATGTIQALVPTCGLRPEQLTFQGSGF